MSHEDGKSEDPKALLLDDEEIGPVEGGRVREPERSREFTDLSPERAGAAVDAWRKLGRVPVDPGVDKFPGFKPPVLEIEPAVGAEGWGTCIS